MLSFLGLLIVVSVIAYIVEARQRRTRAMPGGIDSSIDIPFEQEWELYHNDFSLCSKKIRVCLAELAVDYKPHHVDLIETGSYQNLSRDFLKVNPGATVPVLVHNGHPIYESHEQLQYAADHTDNPNRLVPEQADKRKLMQLWLHKTSIVGDDPIAGMRQTVGNAIPGLTLPIFSAMMTHIPYYRIFEGLLFHRVKKRALFFFGFKFQGVKNLAKIKPLVSVIKQSRLAMHDHLTDLETVLARYDGPWITGAKFTLADVGMMVIFDRLLEVDWIDEFISDDSPAVKQYWQDLQQRSSYQTAVLDFAHPTVQKGKDIIVALKQSNASFRDALVG